MRVTINCDMGEGYGRYSVADDSSLMPQIDLANVACGFHAGDPMIMKRTVRLAAEAGVRVGAHPSLPDLQGFGRRAMTIPPQDLTAIVQYQIGALSGFLTAQGLALNHVKPHGALYGMASRDAVVAGAIAEAVAPFGVPILALAGTVQEEVYLARGLDVVTEFYADLEYADDGTLLIPPVPRAWDPDEAAARVVSALATGATPGHSGRSVPVRATSICVHSDSGNAHEVITAIRARLGAASAGR